MNRLDQEKSPYLLQHQHNPVHWWSWCDQAIEEAQKQNKPIFLSSGYSTCYWCHVMERESFEDEEVAAFLNEHFICIKVDREERPEIDSLYMEAALAINGHGGWPLSVFLDTDLKPFFAASYFPKQQFLAVLDKIQESWKENQEQVQNAGAHLFEVLQTTSRSTSAQDVPDDLWSKAYATFRETFDAQFGGFGGAPKFPASGTIRFLLRYYRRFNEEEALYMARNTLEHMAKGGFYDQIGGGFHRYSTDAEWLIPHFEKMLYDTALLVPAYLECWQLTGESFCVHVVQDSLEYILREMRSEQGGLFTAQDAGLVGQEGEFYVWTQSELEAVLQSDEFALLEEVFEISSVGNFESEFLVLRLRNDCSWERRYSTEVRSLCARLLELRSAKRYPHLDDKVLVSWNALMISALCKGYQVLGNEAYLAAAQQAAHFLRGRLTKNGQLFRRFRDEETRFPALLEDYSYLIQALLDLYQSDANPNWFTWALELQQKLDTLFWDEAEGGYFSASAEDPTLIVRKKEHSDGALPSASAIAVSNLYRLSFFCMDEDLRSRAKAAIAAYSGFLCEYPAAFAYSFIAREYEQFGPVELIIHEAPDAPLSKETKKGVFAQFQPTLVLANGQEAPPALLAERKQHAVYVCAQGSCSAPLETADAALKELRQRFT